MQEKELDGIIINNLKNVYYLTGFWGSNGTVFTVVTVRFCDRLAISLQPSKKPVVLRLRLTCDELAVIVGIVKDMGLKLYHFEDEISVFITTVCK